MWTDSRGYRVGKLIVFKIEIHGIRDIEANKINWTSDLGLVIWDTQTACNWILKLPQKRPVHNEIEVL